MSVFTCTRMPGSLLTVRSGRSARTARSAETLPSPGKMMGTHAETTTTRSSMFHALRKKGRKNVPYQFTRSSMMKKTVVDSSICFREGLLYKANA